MHTQLAGKQECFLHICNETIEYYSFGLLSKTDLLKLMVEFVQFKELIKNKNTFKIIHLAVMLETKDKFALKTPAEIIKDITTTINVSLGK